MVEIKKILIGLAFAFIFSIIAFSNPQNAFATHHGSDSSYPASDTTYVDFSVNPSCDSFGGDTDGDGICNNWEDQTIAGRGLVIDFLSGGITYHYEYPCDPTGADPRADLKCPSPNTRDVYLELDWMNWHEPSTGVLTDIETAFSKAPASPSFPAADFGVTLHIQKGEDLASSTSNDKGLMKYPGATPFHENTMKFETATPTSNGFFVVKEHFFGTKDDRDITTHPLHTVKEWLTAKRQVFHYGIIGHKQFEHTSSSGVAEYSGNDVFITLGSFGAPTVSPYEIGSVDQQEATIMHELGHNFNLHHGGDQDYPCKPNYVSIMNYRLQFKSTFDSTRELDYSRKALKTLDETHLTEKDGVGGKYIDGSDNNPPPPPPPPGPPNYAPQERKVSYASASPYWDWTYDNSALTHEPEIDWNGGGISVGTVSADIDNFSSGCSGSAGLVTNLSGYDDWGGNLVFDFSAVTSSTFGTGAESDIPSETGNGVSMSSAGDEITVEDVRDFNHQDLVHLDKKIENLYSSKIISLTDRDNLEKYILDAMAFNEHDDLAEVGKKLEELKQQSYNLIKDDKVKSELFEVIDDKINSYQIAQDIGGHALPIVESGTDLSDLKNEIKILSEKISNLDNKINDLSGIIKNLKDKISGLLDNNVLLYLAILIIALTIAILVRSFSRKSGQGPSPRPKDEGGAGTASESKSVEVLKNIKKIVDAAFEPARANQST